MERQSMNINVTYQPTELRANKFWFSALNNERGELLFECEHDLEEKSAPQNYMTFEGVQEREEHWLECTNCGTQFDMSGKVEL